MPFLNRAYLNKTWYPCCAKPNLFNRGCFVYWTLKKQERKSIDAFDPLILEQSPENTTDSIIQVHHETNQPRVLIQDASDQALIMLLWTHLVKT